ncbi:MAG: c-type cytochrome [Aquificae bacterium]|nr:c-type cytochrome [Aquificota bacterium]
MKKLAVMVIATVAVSVSTVLASEGEKIFKSKGCGTCHKPNVNTVGPSLKHIAEVYKQKNGDLVAYLKGQADAIVDPKKAAMMKNYLRPLKSLSDEQIKALADYILSH